MRFRWEETVQREIDMTPDQVRKAFGLGGTADKQLPARLACLWPMLGYRLADVSDNGKNDAHYHQGDGKPGHRNAPPCYCEEESAPMRPEGAAAGVSMVDVSRQVTRLLTIDGVDASDY
jgi:hypothetical protein